MKTKLQTLITEFPYGNDTATLIYQHILEKAEPTETGQLTHTFDDTQLAKDLALPVHTLRPHLTRLNTANRLAVLHNPNDRSIKTTTFTTNPNTWLTYQEAGELQWDIKVKQMHARLELVRQQSKKREWWKPELPPIAPELENEAFITIIASLTSHKSRRLPRLATFRKLTGWDTKKIRNKLRNLERNRNIHCLERGFGRRETAYVTSPQFDYIQYRHDDLDAYLQQLRWRTPKP